MRRFRPPPPLAPPPDADLAPAFSSTGVHPEFGHDPLIALAREIPGFGGLYLEGSRVVVLVTDLKDTSVARSEAQPYVQWLAANLPVQLGSAPEVLVRRSDFGFTALREWRERITWPVLDTEGVVYLGTSEQRNRIMIGVEDGAARDRVVDVLGRLGVPPEAVAFHETSLKLESCNTLRDHCRPIEGWVAGGATRESRG